MGKPKKANRSKCSAPSSRKTASRSVRAPSNNKSVFSEHDDFDCLRKELESVDLKIRVLPKDGNCLFRAVADQLFGFFGSGSCSCCDAEEAHSCLRRQCVRYLESHRETYEPFIENDVPFKEYCQT